jgi:hypothetical protein
MRKCKRPHLFIQVWDLVNLIRDKSENVGYQCLSGLGAIEPEDNPKQGLSKRLTPLYTQLNRPPASLSTLWQDPISSSSQESSWMMPCLPFTQINSCFSLSPPPDPLPRVHHMLLAWYITYTYIFFLTAFLVPSYCMVTLMSPQ